MSINNNVYYRSLQLHLKYLQDLYKNKSFSDNNVVNVEENTLITKDLPLKIDSFNIHYLNLKQIKEMGKDGDFFLIAVSPIELKGASIVVSITDFYVHYKRRKLFYVNNGGSILEYKYDCQTEHYILVKNEQVGI